MSVLAVSGGLTIAFAGHPLARLVGDRVDPLVSLPDDETLRGDLLKWLVTGALLAYVAVVERDSLLSVGARLPDPVSVGVTLDGVGALLAWWVGGVLATIVLSTVVYNVFRHYDLGTQDAFAAEQAARPLPAFLFTAVTAGVTESVLYQAYPIERLAALTGSLLAAGVVAWLAFTAVHYASGRFSLEETVFTSAPALVVTALYVLTGSVYVVVLVHTTVNLLSVLSR